MEGEPCGDDINAVCGDGMYCAMGLSWCGTPPVTGECRRFGDCGAPSDCENANNDWSQPRCVGEILCTTNGKCDINCGNFPL